MNLRKGVKWPKKTSERIQKKGKGPPKLVKMVKSFHKTIKTLDMDTKGKELAKEGKSSLKMLNGIQVGKGATHEIGQKYEGVVNIPKGNLQVKNKKTNLGHISREGLLMKLACLQQKNQQN